jgi:hypothetical protein
VPGWTAWAIHPPHVSLAPRGWCWYHQTWPYCGTDCIHNDRGLCESLAFILHPCPKSLRSISPEVDQSLDGLDEYFLWVAYVPDPWLSFRPRNFDVLGVLNTFLVSW